jgi:hypothetical protein
MAFCPYCKAPLGLLHRLTAGPLGRRSSCPSCHKNVHYSGTLLALTIALIGTVASFFALVFGGELLGLLGVISTILTILIVVFYARPVLTTARTIRYWYMGAVVVFIAICFAAYGQT